MTELLAEGDYHAVVLRAGINPAHVGDLRKHSKEQYWLLLTTLH